MKSMTGFGRGLATSETLSCTVEIKSVNSRFCDLILKVPRQINPFEESIRQEIQRQIHRGKVEVSVVLREIGEREREITVNHALCRQIKELLVAENFYDCVDTVPLTAVMAISHDWVTMEEKPIDEGEVQTLVHTALREALQGLSEMRLREGENMFRELSLRITTLETILQEIDTYKEDVVKKYEARLLERIQNTLEKTNVAISMDRFLQEVATMADKTDITEEVVRFSSHVVQLKNTLTEEGSIGRKLDFLLQEMNREVNTMGSKGADLAVVDRVVALKSELEKVREQIQNIE